MNIQSKSRVAGALIFCIVIVLFVGFDSLERQRYRETLQTRTIDRLSHIRAHLETEINANFYLTRGLIAYVSIHPDIDSRTFDRLCGELMKNKSYIRNIALAPNSIVRFVYPLAGNEKAIGLDYTTNRDQWPAVARIIASRNTVVAGPVELAQGGIAFICRTPIYVTSATNSPTEAEPYWGLASIVIEKEPLFKAAGYYSAAADIRIAIRGKDGLGDQGDMIEGDKEIFATHPVLLPVNLPEGSWQLAAIPAGGWNMASPYLLPLRLLGLVAALLAGLATSLWLNNQEKNRIRLETAWKEAERAQEELKLNEEFLNTVIDNIPAIIFVKDAKTLRFVRMNTTGARQLGYEAFSFIGKTDFDFFSAAEARFFIDKDREVLNAGTMLDIPEETVQTKDKGRMVLHTRKIPLFDTKGNTTYLLGISENITEQIAIRTEKERLEKLLQQAQKLETIGKMAAGVAHDLNNILSGIINYPELLLLQLPKDSPLVKPLEDIQNSGKRAANVVADLLSIARGVAAVRENTDLSRLVDDYLQSPEYRKLTALFPELRCTVQLAPDLPMVCCTPVHIRKCLMNLVNNAAEAFDATPGEITITGDAVDLHHPLPGFPDITPGRYATLSVQDNGKGISPQDLEHIFEPFYTKKTMGRSGTGLGLTVVWNTMNDHKGAVTVSSDPQRGTIFRLYLPAAHGEAVPPPAASPMEELYGEGQTILVVDDEPHQRDIASKILHLLRYSVTTVSSGEEAVDYLASHSAGLVILDMVMAPGRMNGRETYEAIIRQCPGQKAIIASGYVENEELVRIQTLGAGQYVTKPYTLEQLGVAVRHALH